jgi:integrase
MRPGLRPKTIQLYRYLLRVHLREAFGATTVARIIEADVRRWRADMLSAGVTPVTAAKAYRLLKSILATAVDDGLIRRNPCRIKGASVEKSPERPVLTVGQVYALADAIGPRYRALVLLACFCGLRWESWPDSSAPTSTAITGPSASPGSSAGWPEVSPSPPRPNPTPVSAPFRCLP